MLHSKKSALRLLIVLGAIAITLSGCWKDPVTPAPKTEEIPVDKTITYKGMFVLNQGSFGQNNASIDYVDFASGSYTQNIYAEKNPNAVKELGDTGNDIKVHGKRLYIAVNGSNKVEVLDLTGKRIGEVDVTSPRYLAFKDGRGYVTSYEGKIVAFDTATLQVANEVQIGRNPEELAIVDDVIYAANSGGLTSNTLGYETTVSAVKINADGSMNEVKKIEVAINLNRLRVDAKGRMWVTSQGDYNSIAPKTYILEKKGEYYEKVKELDIAITNIAFSGDRALYTSTTYGANGVAQSSYGQLKLDTQEKVGDSFITDGSESQIGLAYGLIVNPTNGDVLVFDCKDYKQNGDVFCYGADGKLKWKKGAGMLPCNGAFIQ